MSPFQGIEPAAELIQAACAGELSAHAALYRIYQRPVYTLVRRLVSRSAVADDVFQEVFVEILRNISAYSATGSFSGWVRSIAVSKCLMYLRSPWHRSLLWLDADEPAAATALVDPAVRLDVQTQLNMDLTRALARLPAVSRSVVWLHDVEGYTHLEIARLLGRTPSFSKSQLARAHERLREWLEPKEISQVTVQDMRMDAPTLNVQVLTD
jgi:RNA polymerase sigma-70 factor (ECF subfamily)